MACLIVKALSRARMKLHTSMLGMFFVYTLGLSMPIFKKKSSQRFLGKVPNFVYYIKMIFYVIHKFWNFSQKSPRRFFLENRHSTWFQGVYKKRPQHRSMKLHPCPAQNTAFQASHCSALLLGCLKYCSRL